MTRSITTHLRRHVVGYLVAFLALTIAPALAAPEEGDGGGLEKDSVRSKHIKDGQVHNPDLGASAVDGTKVADDSLSGADVNESTLDLAPLLSGYQLRVNGTCPPGQSIREIAAGGGVTCEPDDVGGGSGGPPSGPAGGDLAGTYPNPTLTANAVASAELAANAVTTAKIADAQVTMPKLADLAVTTAKLANGAVTNAKLAANAVNSASIADGSLGLADTNATQVQSRVSGTCVAGQSIRAVAQNGTVTCEPDDAGGPPGGAAGGDLAGSTYPNPAIAANAVTNAKLADNAVASAEITNNTIAGADVLDNTLAGADVNESTLGTVPTADTVDGLHAAKFHRESAPNTDNQLQTVLSLGGLEVRYACVGAGGPGGAGGAGDAPSLYVTTNADDATISVIRGGTLVDSEFDFDSNEAIPMPPGGLVADHISVAYSRPSGQVVSAQIAAFGSLDDGCRASGTALGG